MKMKIPPRLYVIMVDKINDIYEGNLLSNYFTSNIIEGRWIMVLWIHLNMYTASWPYRFSGLCESLKVNSIKG
jgi:hypothetical protein